jgi:monoamine oxidase
VQSACMHVKQSDVIIVGAGAAGLAAASMLANAGLSVRVLEARDRLGGRLATLHDPYLPVAVELGAEFVQGLPRRSWQVARAAGAIVCEMVGQFWTTHDGALVRDDDQRTRSTELMRRVDMFHGRDTPLATVLGEIVASEPALRQDAEMAARWVEGYDAADPELISARALVRQHRAEALLRNERTFRLPLGYDALAHWLGESLPPESITFQSTVSAVHWQVGHIEVESSSARYSARRAVIAVPLGVLQQGGVLFDPALPDKERAMRALHVGAVIKVILRFDDAFWWTAERAELTFLQTPGEDFAVFWTSYPVIAPVLSCWVGGPGATKLSQLPDQAIVDRALRVLRRVFRQRVERRLQAWYLHNWQTDPFAGGAYSYIGVGGLSAQRDLARPVHGTLFFAGEATETAGHHATVHGALNTGDRAAAEVIGSLR